MNKVLSAAALLAPTLSPTSEVLAQEVRYGTEVCVNASDLAEAKRRFPNARLHVLPDFADSRMNGWRLVSGTVGRDGRIMTYSGELKVCQRVWYCGAPGAYCEG